MVAPYRAFGICTRATLEILLQQQISVCNRSLVASLDKDHF
jgi:hypothetical protein